MSASVNLNNRQQNLVGKVYKTNLKFNLHLIALFSFALHLPF